MRVARDDRQPWERVVSRRGLPQLRQHEQRHQEGPDDVDGEGPLDAVDELEGGCREPRVLAHDIQPLQLGRLPAEAPHAVVALQIDLPDLYDAGVGLEGVLDVFLGVEAPV